MKKFRIPFIFTIFIIIMCSLTILLSNTLNQDKDEDKIKVVATLFPQYDFARQIGKEKVSVSLLLPPGSESHSYEPTPSDIIKINSSDLFIYTGEEMEPWAGTISNSLESSVSIIDISKNVNLISLDSDEHIHEHENDHHHTYDPHIWMDPNNAIIMIENILNSLISIDPENADYYINNANNYKEYLRKLDLEISSTLDTLDNNKLVFAVPFSYIYFTERYNLEYISTYDFCGENTEPSAHKMKEVIDYINSNNINYIFIDDLSSTSTANTLSKETNTQIIKFYGIHNVTKNDIKNNESYLSLMYKNLENLKIALK